MFLLFILFLFLGWISFEKLRFYVFFTLWGDLIFSSFRRYRIIFWARRSIFVCPDGRTIFSYARHSCSTVEELMKIVKVYESARNRRAKSEWIAECFHGDGRNEEHTKFVAMFCVSILLSFYKLIFLIGQYVTFDIDGWLCRQLNTKWGLRGYFFQKIIIE